MIQILRHVNLMVISRLTILLFCSSNYIDVLAQSKTSSSVPAGNSQVGYVYRLPYNYHVKYSSVKSKTTIEDHDPSLPPGLGKIVITQTRQLIFCGDKRSHFIKNNFYDDSQTQELEDDCINKVFEPAIPVKPISKTYCVTDCNNLLAKTLIIENDIDFVSRYWYRPTLLNTHWYNKSKFIFTRHRLRVAVTQSDSGKLQLSIYDTQFQDGSKPPDVRTISQATMLSGGKKIVTDFARPITNTDSAQDFYLQINNKLMTGNSISYLSIPYALTQYGAMTVPFKYRWAPHNRYIRAKSPSGADSVVSGPTESTASFNLAGYIGRRWGRTRFYFSPTRTHNTTSFMVAAFLGPSLVPLSMSNTEAKDSFIVNSPTNIIAISTGGSAVLEWRSVDIGIFGGWDFPLVANSGWIYRNKFWIGFGIGVGLGMFSSTNAQVQSSN